MLTIENWNYGKIKAELKSLTKEQNIKVAILSARGVLGAFESKHPDDARPRLAIEAAESYPNNQSHENKSLTADDASAADDASDAAYAATADAVYSAAAADESVKQKIIDYINELKGDGEMEYPYIGKLMDDDLTVLFYSRGAGVVVRGCDTHEVGELGNTWHERAFKNITREHLDDTYGEVESQEHAEFIIKLAECCGFNYAGGASIKGARSFVFYSDGMLIFYHLTDCDLPKNKKSRKIALPLPPKEEDMKSEDMKSEEWPKVGDDVSYYSGEDAMSKDECNLATHCIVDTWKDWDELKVIAYVNMHGEKNPVVQNTRTHEVSSIRNDLIRRNPSYELAGKIDEAVSATIEMDDLVKISKAIISGEIEGLEYNQNK